MTEAEALDMAAKAAGWPNGWGEASRFAPNNLFNAIRAHAATIMENAALKAEIEALKALQESDGELLTIAWMDGAHCSNKAHREQVAALKAENKRLREMVKPQWFYAGEDQSSDRCRFSVDEVLEDELCGWGPPKTGKHVVHVSTALPGPDIWVAVHVFTDEEKDARDDDETWAFEEFSTEAEARAALKEIEGD